MPPATRQTRQTLKRKAPSQSLSPSPQSQSSIKKKPQPSSPPNTNSMPSPSRRFFLITASRDHLLSGIAQGIVQANHGIKPPLLKMRAGDGVVVYAPRLVMLPRVPRGSRGSKDGSKDAKGKGKIGVKGDDGGVYRKFCGIAIVADGDVFQVDMTESWRPWRRRVRWIGSRESEEGGGDDDGVGVKEVPMKDVLSQLECLDHGRGSYGMKLRRGFLEIGKEDWRILWERMVGSLEEEMMEEQEQEQEQNT